MMNLFRFPLNLLVVSVLLNVNNMANSTVFALITLWMGLALVAHFYLDKLMQRDALYAADHIDLDQPEEGVQDKPKEKPKEKTVGEN